MTACSRPPCGKFAACALERGPGKHGGGEAAHVCGGDSGYGAANDQLQEKADGTGDGGVEVFRRDWGVGPVSKSQRATAPWWKRHLICSRIRTHE